jgi:hypothetical protein
VFPFECGFHRIFDDLLDDIFNVPVVIDFEPHQSEQNIVTPPDEHSGREADISMLAGVARCDEIGDEVVVAER